LKRFLSCLPLLCVALAGCGRSLAEGDVPFAGAMVDGILAGVAEKDYGAFSRNFSDAMKDALKEGDFPDIVAGIERKLGEFEGMTFLSAAKARSPIGMIWIVTYRARYSREPDARIRIWISEKEGARRVEGFAAAPVGELK
jgi:hypothetical protein